MQNASAEYKESMKSPLRNRGYIRATIGVVYSTAQKNLSVDSSKSAIAYYSNPNIFTMKSASKLYATGEQDFARTDGSMYFLPGDRQQSMYNNGLVSAGLFGSIYLSFHGEEGLDIKGLAINFGDYYPVDFIVENDEGVHEYTGNDKSYWTTDDVFNGTSFFKITPSKMVNGQGRLRIFEIVCGVANTFSNENTLSYSFKDYVSSISEILPSRDMKLTVDNQNLYYSADNPDSALAYMEVGQEIEVSFGYDVSGNGDIEWLPPHTCYLKSWSADDVQAQFIATDRFDYLSDTYWKGLYRPAGISLYALAEDVLADASVGDQEYFLDPYLKDIIVYNPLPAVTHSEALQIIANAGRCALYEDRENRIHMQASFIPDKTISSNGETAFSHIENVLLDDDKDTYVMGSKDFSSLDGTANFLPRTGRYLHTGYISEAIYTDASVFLFCDNVDALAYFSESGSRYLKNNPDELYATGEQDFSRVDGSMRFLPRDHGSDFTPNGFVSADLAGNLHFSLDQLDKISFDGLEIDFGENYPTEFKIETDAGETSYSLDSSYFKTEESFSNITYIRIKPVTMKQAGRLRVNSIWLRNAYTYADSSRTLIETPKIAIDLEAAYVPYGILVQFRNLAPEEMHIATYYEGAVVTEWTVTEPGLEYITHDRLALFDRMIITFPKGIPNGRIVVERILIGDVTDYTLTYTTDLQATPAGTRKEKLQSINVQRSLYTESPAAARELAQETVTLSPSDNECTAYISNAAYGFSASVVDNASVSCQIVESSNYYVRLRFSGLKATTNVTYIVYGKEYVVDKYVYVKRHHPNGEIIQWSNPLISSEKHAKDLEEWLASYYLGDVEYEISWRGDPRVDANDLFYLELKNRDKAMIRCYQNELTFSGGWSGRMNARKAVL